MIKKFKAFILLLFFLIFTGCNKKDLKEYNKILNYFDRKIEIKLFTTSEKKANKLFSDIEKIYQTYEKISDRNDSNSEIYYIRYNNSSEKNIKISEEMSELINYGLEIYENSNGLLSINTGDIFDIWDSNEILDKQALSKLDTNIDRISLNNNILLNNHVNLSFDNFIMGYVNNKVKEYLEEMHINYYFINSKDEIIAGKSFNQSSFIVALANPFDSSLLQTFNIQNKVVITKTIYCKSYQYDDQVYSNIVDAKKKTMGREMVSVTVLSDDSKVGEMLANMLFLTNYEDGKQIADKYHISAIWCYYDKYGNEIIRKTDNM